jgi:hypothetical protein
MVRRDACVPSLSARRCHTLVTPPLTGLERPSHLGGRSLSGPDDAMLDQYAGNLSPTGAQQ